MQKIIKINDRFGRLTIISKGASIQGGKTIKHWFGTWNCKCDCGKTVIVKTYRLNNGTTRSCGCIITQYGQALIPNQKINRLTTISFKNGRWTCKCECGNITTITTTSITSSNTKSCGCLNSEKTSSPERIKKLQDGRRKHLPQQASAKRIWSGYVDKDSNCVDFDSFLNVSQKNCFYCGIVPNRKYNFFTAPSSKSSEYSRNNGNFIYNGLDRVDSKLYHTIDNIVPCCYDCNRAKNNLSVENFLKWIGCMKVKEFSPISIEKVIVPNTQYLRSSINCIWYLYKDGGLSIEEFYYLSQMNCFYCEGKPNNIFNKPKTDKKSSKKAKLTKGFVYNGLDRVNNNLSHIKENVVPCCKYCNFAKSKLTLNEFQEWIIRIQIYQKNKG